MAETGRMMERFMSADYDEIERLFLLVVQMGADYRELDQAAIDWLRAEYKPTVAQNAHLLPNEQTLKCCWKTGKIAGSVAWGAGSSKIMREHIEIGAKTVEARARAVRAGLPPQVLDGLGTGC